MFNATGADTYVWYSLPSYESVDDHVGNRLRAEVPNDTWVYVVGTNNDSHCSTKDSVHVIDLPQTEFKYEVQPNWIEEGSSRVRFVGLSPGSGTTWLWEPGDGSDEQKGSVVAYEYDVTNVPEEFNAKVYAEDKFRCRFEAEIPIHVWKPFWAPDAFTPNGDGTNDKFHFYGGQYIEEFTFVIYNRLGEIVFSGDSLNTEWDGTFNGKPCPWGVYGWVANYRSDQFGMAKSGTVRGAVSIVK